MIRVGNSRRLAHVRAGGQPRALPHRTPLVGSVSQLEQSTGHVPEESVEFSVIALNVLYAVIANTTIRGAEGYGVFRT